MNIQQVHVCVHICVRVPNTYTNKIVQGALKRLLQCVAVCCSVLQLPHHPLNRVHSCSFLLRSPQLSFSFFFPARSAFGPGMGECVHMCACMCVYIPVVYKSILSKLLGLLRKRTLFLISILGNNRNERWRAKRSGLVYTSA